MNKTTYQRRPLTKNFTKVPNDLFDNKNLSLKAKGLLASLLRHKDEFVVSVEFLAKQLNEGRTSINSALKELENSNYLIRTRILDASKRFAGYEWTIRDEPMPTTRKEPKSEKPHTDTPTTGNTLLISMNRPGFTRHI